MTGSELGGERGRVLLVEDDAVAAHFAMHVLGKRGGFDVTHTPDPAVAVQRVGSEAWDLVLTDAEMPGMPGLEFLEAVRRLAPDLPVAVITAHEAADSAMRPLRDGADEFLQKPVPPDRLLASVASLVAKGRAARQSAAPSGRPAARPPGRPAVLAIGAHPGDAEMGAAGTLLVHRGMGHEVSILTLTRRACGDAKNTGAGASELAALALGATLFPEDLQAAQLEEGGPAIGVISRVVQTVRPAVVYTHSLHDVRPDHRDAHRAAMHAASEVARVYCFQSPTATVDFRPARFVTVDAQLARKLLAIRAFAAQAQTPAYPEPDLIESTARYWSRFGDGRYAEAFEVIRDDSVAGGRAEDIG